MGSWKEQYPSKYLKAADLGDSNLTGTIVACNIERVGQGSNAEDRLVLEFRESSLKPLVLNKTNCEAIEKITGTDDTEAWIGRKVTLYASETTFQGRTVSCVRVKAPKAPSKPLAPVPAPIEPDDSDEDAPF